jgi:hypothetical protein
MDLNLIFVVKWQRKISIHFGKHHCVGEMKRSGKQTPKQTSESTTFKGKNFNEILEERKFSKTKPSLSFGLKRELNFTNISIDNKQNKKM